MTLHAVEDLLNQTSTLRKAQQLVGERPGARFNIFKILGMESDEVYTHSQFLAEMLHPQGAHGMGDIFLQLWLKQIQLSDFDTEEAKSIAEHHIGTVTDTEGGRIDILIHNKVRKIVIENKIFARDQKNQLLRYHNFDKEAKLYYLTLFGTPPAKESTGDGLLDSEKYTCISYAKDVLLWLEDCRKEATDIPVLRETITQYIALTRKLTNQHFDGKMQAELVNKILGNAENLTSFFELQSPGTTQAIYKVVTQKMEEDLERLAERLHLKFNFYFKTRNRWQGFTFYGNPELDQLKVWIDFQFDQFPNRLVFGFSYLPDSEARPNKIDFDISPLVSGFKSAYTGVKSHEWWPCYTIWDYQPIDICNDIYFSGDAFAKKVEEKIVQMLEIARIAQDRIVAESAAK